nr:unnamed protein product [Callosobruchus chinensis]
MRLKRFKDLNFFQLEDEEVTSDLYHQHPPPHHHLEHHHHQRGRRRGRLLITLPYHQSCHK